MNTFLIALGANLPFEGNPPEHTLHAALDALLHEEIRVDAVSEFYRTPCFPAGAGPDYVNAAARLTSDMSARDMLDTLHTIEARFGRERQVRWGMRTLDLDLVAAGSDVLPDLQTFEAWRSASATTQRAEAPDTLILPHPRLQDRAFVLVPLRDVAPDWRHPVLDRTIAQFCDDLPSEALSEITRL